MKTLGKRGIGRQRLRQEFKRDKTVQLRLARSVDDTHAALADELDNFELWESCGDVLNRRGRFLGGGLAGLGRRSGRGKDAFRAEPLRRIGRQGGLALRTPVGDWFSFHTAPILRIPPAEVTNIRPNFAMLEFVALELTS